MPVNCFADEITETFETYSQEAEWLLRDRVQQNQKLTESDYAFTASHLNWDRVKTNTEHRRVMSSLNLLAIAGTPPQQQAKREAAKKAAEVAEKELPKLNKERDALNAKIAALERDRDLSAKRVEETDSALAKLPEVAPAFRQKQVAAAETLLNTQGVGKDLRDTTARLQELKCILNLGNVYESQAKHIEYGLKRLLPDAVTTITNQHYVNYQYSPEWPSLKAQHEREFAELNQRLPELQAAFDTALAAVRKPLIDYFMNPEEN